jgi:hypothetical protein
MVMNWIPVENSQAMSHYGYDPASQTFAIQTAGGMPYFYLDVPPEVHARFTQASSKGKFWITEIKPRYQCQKGDGTLAIKSPAAAPVHPKVERIIQETAEKANAALVKSTAVLEESVVRPFSLQVADLRTHMDLHCQPVLAEIGALAQQAAGMTVASEGDYTAAAELGKKLADKRKGITAMMQPTKRAIDQVKQVVLDKEKELLTLAEAGETRLKKLCTDYRVEQQRSANAAADDERRRLLKEAEDKRIQQAEQAQAAGRDSLAEKLLSTPVVAPKVEVAAAVPKVKGVSGRTGWKWRIKDINLIPDEFWMLDESAIGARVRADKDKTSIPGIEAYPEESTSF